jgi:hypothetical protein
MDQQLAGEGRRPEALPLRFSDYVALLRDTGGSVRGEEPDKPLAAESGTILRAFGLNPEQFASSIRNYARSFFTMVGHVHRIDVEAKRRGYRRRMGLRAAKQLYRNAAA